MCGKCIYRKKDKSNRVTLILPFHHKFRGIQQVLQKFYNQMITCNPDLKQTVPYPPMIFLRWAPNIWDKVVEANHSRHKRYQPILPPEGKSYIAALINHSKTVTNTISNQLCYIKGNANTVGAICSALCAKYKKLYVGQTRQSHNKRFNGHHSDAVHHPDWSDLAQHYNKNGCDIRHDLEISVLEHARGSSDYMKHKKGKWIMRL